MKLNELSKDPKSEVLSRTDILDLIGKTIGFYPDLRSVKDVLLDMLKFIAKDPKNVKPFIDKYSVKSENIIRRNIILETTIEKSYNLSELIAMYVFHKSPDSPEYDKYVNVIRNWWFPLSEAAFSEKLGIKVILDRKIPVGTFNPFDSRSQFKSSEMGVTSLLDLVEFVKESIDLGGYIWEVMKKVSNGEGFGDVMEFTKKYAQWRQNPNSPFDADPSEALTDEQADEINKEAVRIKQEVEKKTKNPVKPEKPEVKPETIVKSPELRKEMEKKQEVATTPPSEQKPAEEPKQLEVSKKEPNRERVRELGLAMMKARDPKLTVNQRNILMDRLRKDYEIYLKEGFPNIDEIDEFLGEEDVFELV